MEKIILELLLVIEEKHKVILKQQYENAAKLRDKEKQIEEELYSLIQLFKNTNECSIKQFLKEEFDIDYPFSAQSVKQLKREIQIKFLGL
jgi:hypothetical protein